MWRKKNNWPLVLNLQIEAPNKIFIKGSGFASEWKGSVLLSGDSKAFLVNGDLSIINGTYLFQGKEFQIKEGKISFAGDPEKKTTLYLIASKQIDDINAEIILRGPLKDPAIAFRSNPPLSQSEILSWILFNRGLSDISSFQGRQLNQSIKNLKNDNEEPDVLTKIRNQIGIDRIDISRDEYGEENEVSVQVGKYIYQGVYVSVNKSITAETNRLAIEANLINHFKLQAEVGDDSAGQLLLKWKKDY